MRTQTANTPEQAAQDHATMCGIDNDGPIEATIEAYPFHDIDLFFTGRATPRLRATMPEPWNDPTYAGRTKKEDIEFINVIHGLRDGISRNPIMVFTVTKLAGSSVAIKTVMTAKCHGYDAMGGPCPNQPVNGCEVCGLHAQIDDAQEAVS